MKAVSFMLVKKMRDFEKFIFESTQLLPFPILRNLSGLNLFDTDY